jgi:hypothetical protein
MMYRNGALPLPGLDRRGDVEWDVRCARLLAERL